MTVEAALLTGHQLPCVLWPMALDNTLMARRALVACREAMPDSTHARSRAEGQTCSTLQARVS
jgi:hypothetical protein